MRGVEKESRARRRAIACALSRFPLSLLASLHLTHRQPPVHGARVGPGDRAAGLGGGRKSRCERRCAVFWSGQTSTTARLSVALPLSHTTSGGGGRDRGPASHHFHAAHLQRILHAHRRLHDAHLHHARPAADEGVVERGRGPPSAVRRDDGGEGRRRRRWGSRGHFRGGHCCKKGRVRALCARAQAMPGGAEARDTPERKERRVCELVHSLSTRATGPQSHFTPAWRAARPAISRSPLTSHGILVLTPGAAAAPSHRRCRPCPRRGRVLVRPCYPCRAGGRHGGGTGARLLPSRDRGGLPAWRGGQAGADVRVY